VKQVRLKGGGNGHGVGMCQSGAIRMASDGFSAERIIAHYYPGVSLVRIY
jgi:stage II sporulation protein D